MTWCPIRGFWNMQEWFEWPRIYNHLDREQYGKLEDNADIKPGGIWDSRHQKEESFKETHFHHYCL